ncbi:MAG TPA: hypothetical protein VER11_10600 [Polyangiaceae bacterium]|nr:hypothetical protein [Polyangiaceae bacterium]
MVITPLMSKARWLIFGLLTIGLTDTLLCACGSGDGRPASLVSAGGAAGHRGALGGSGGVSSDNAGQGPSDDGGSSPGDDAGAGGEIIMPAAPLAMFPGQLQVNVGCGTETESAEFLIRNAGLLPLTISSATATEGYAVKTELPLQIAAMSSGLLQIAAPKPIALASVGDMTTGTLTFVTNETDAPSHEVQLSTTLFGGLLEFTDGDGKRLNGALPLTYLSSDACPDNVTYRVHNTGNVAFTLFGPTFSPHFGGTSTGTSGRAVGPDQYIELEVSGNSMSDGACSGSGELTFTVQGSFCGAVPKLAVSWPVNVATSGCTCAAAAE